MRNYRKSTSRTIDELVFYHLGAQLKNHFPDYHTIKFSQVLLELRPHFAPLPKYFSQPLFKHPPFFAALVSLSLRIFGEHYYSAAYVSCLFGVLLILLTYWIGALVFDECVGLAAAFLVWMDPVNIISSQKIWMDTTVTFFMTLAVLLFLLGLKDSRGSWFLAFGGSCGLAMLTKYTGVLTVFSAVLFCALYEQRLFKRKSFLLGLILPLGMLLPWVYWNYICYGTRLWVETLGVHGLFKMAGTHSLVWGFLALAALSFFCALKKNVREFFQQRIDWLCTKSWQNVIFGIFFLFLLWKLFPALSPAFLPETKWNPGAFSYNGLFFYFIKLSQFSLFYVLGLCTFVAPFEKMRSKNVRLLQCVLLTIMLFFSLWKSYQSRYVLAATPVLLILGAAFWIELIRKVSLIENLGMRRVSLVIVSFMTAYMLLKTYYINLVVSFPNAMVYF